MSVLVVDPDPTVRGVVQAALRSFRYETFAAAEAPDALSLATRTPAIDLLLTEVDLPRISGPELAVDFVRLSSRTAVLFMAAYLERALPVDVPLIQKPFTAQPLVAAVEAVLAEARAAEAELSRELERAAEMRLRSMELRLETESVRQKSAEILRRSRELLGYKDKSNPGDQ